VEGVAGREKGVRFQGRVVRLSAEISLEVRGGFREVVGCGGEIEGRRQGRGRQAGEGEGVGREDRPGGRDNLV